MKQNITTAQLAELTPEQHVIWRKWLEKHHVFGQTHLMSGIGVMIEFLNEHINNMYGTYIDDSGYERVLCGTNISGKFDIGWKGELCDSLWESVKAFLRK